MAINLNIGVCNGKKYLSIMRRYRDKKSGKVKSITIKSLGYLEKLKQEYPDPIAHFREVVSEMKIEDKQKSQPLIIKVEREPVLSESDERRKNFGYAALSKIYNELGLELFFNNNSRSLKAEYNVSSIMKVLVYSRILSPASKKSTYEQKDIYFEKSDFSLDDVYHTLSFVDGLKEKVQRHIHRKVSERYGRNCELVYYDVSNYYFEIDEQDKLRRLGVSKEHRPNPIVQMGLFTDRNGIPISYRLFPGNTNDCETLKPLLSEMRREFNMGRIIVVADRGINTQKNIQSNILNREGYVYSQTVRGGHKELKEYVLCDKEYRPHGVDGRIKSRIYPRLLSVTDINGKVKQIRIDELQIVFYDETYARRAKSEREAVLLKAHELVDNPAKYNKATSYGAAKYIKNLEFDESTGEIRASKLYPVFDEEKLREEEKFDGYYCIVSSELDKSADEIIKIYKGLWNIEEAFKVTKSTLETRPVYLSREEHIEAHFLICFIALCIVRILQYRLNYKYSVSAIVKSLKKVTCSLLNANIYHFDYFDRIVSDIGETLGIDFSQKYLQLGEIKKILGNTKK